MEADVALRVRRYGAGWQAIGHEGSYGLGTRVHALALACAAVAARPGRTRAIAVDPGDGEPGFTVTRVRVLAGAQLFQDDVP